MKLTIPKLSLVLLIGPASAGKTTFALKHFHPEEIFSPDRLSNIETENQHDNPELLEAVAARLSAGMLAVVDSNCESQQARAQWVHLAKTQHCQPVAIVINPSDETRLQWLSSLNEIQSDSREFSKQHKRFLQMANSLKKEGFRQIEFLNSQAEIDSVELDRVPLPVDKREETGPFDLIGDVHGCCDELEELLQQLGYRRRNLDTSSPIPQVLYSHPEGRKAVFVGDLVDRGPRNLDAVYLVRNMIEAGTALCVLGNHDVKIMKYLQGKKVNISTGRAVTIAEFEVLPEIQREICKQEILDFFCSLPCHYVLDEGKLVVAHAGLKEEYQGKQSAKVDRYATHGDATGELDQHGLPVRRIWATDYQGSALVIYGHTPVPNPDRLNNTVNLDTGCVFGGKMTALRYPELELVSIKAHYTYHEPRRVFLPADQQAPLFEHQEKNF